MSDTRFELVRGDALAALAEMTTASVDAVVTDPPYSSGGFTRGDRTASPSTKYVKNTSANTVLPAFAGDGRDQRGWAYWSALWLGEALRVTRPSGALAVFVDWRQLPTLCDVVQAGGWVWRGIVPWHKPGARPQLGRPAAACEYVVWATAGARPLVGEALPGFYQGIAPREREHITQKPVDVMRGLVRLAPPDGVVLDPFTGAGTTGVAAVLEGRQFRGVEIVEHFADVAERRIRNSLYQATHDDPGVPSILDALDDQARQTEPDSADPEDRT